MRNAQFNTRTKTDTHTQKHTHADTQTDRHVNIHSHTLTRKPLTKKLVASIERQLNPSCAKVLVARRALACAHTHTHELTWSETRIHVHTHTHELTWSKTRIHVHTSHQTHKHQCIHRSRYIAQTEKWSNDIVQHVLAHRKTRDRTTELDYIANFENAHSRVTSSLSSRWCPRNQDADHRLPRTEAICRALNVVEGGVVRFIGELGPGWVRVLNPFRGSRPSH